MAFWVELSQFIGKEYYSIWKEKMKDVLIQQRVSKVHEDLEKYPDTIKVKSDEIVEINEIAHSYIVLHLFDNMLGRVEHETAKELWKHLTSYSSKNLCQTRFICFKNFLVFSWTHEMILNSI